MAFNPWYEFCERWLLFRILRNPDHGRTEQAVLQHVAVLQFVHYGMVGNVFGLDHFDGLMKSRIERLALGRDLPHSKFLKNVLQLLVDEFNPGAKFRTLR